MARPPGNRLLIKKSVDQLQREASGSHLKRSLGAVNLVFLGIGCIIGAGIYVMTGNAAANYAGPAVMLSFVVAFFACVFAGLCYAELASTMPVAGSAYSYSYTTLGEIFAWIMGWLLVLEYGIAASTVAAGWSANVVSLVHQLQCMGLSGPHAAEACTNLAPLIPANLTTSFVQAVPGEHGLTFIVGNGFNLLGALGILMVTSLLVIGVSESATANAIIVFIKVGVLVLFVAMGISYVHPDHWQPFIPANEGGFKYGLPGIFRAASVIFFAYVGFEAVSTAAGEAKNPKRDMPIGILGSLIVCTILYMLVAAVLTGIVPFRELGVAAPMALAADRMGIAWFAFAIKIGAVAGLSSVMLILVYGQSRVFFAMARDGLLPRFFATLHQKFRTPWIGTIVLGLIIAVGAAFLPIEILGDLVSLGTATAFAIVCISVLWLRKQRPDLERPFTAPFGVMTPLLGIFFAVVMIAPLIWDIISKAQKGDLLPAGLLGGYLSLGALIYIFYGFWNSRLAKGLDIIEDGLLPEALTAQAHGLDEKH